MHNMSDIIEQYIKRLFEESNEDVVEIQRANIAQRFDCVPSQLNYVIKTRFTNEPVSYTHLTLPTICSM